MSQKIKIHADRFDADFLGSFFEQIQTSRGIIQGLEVEHLVMLEFGRKHYLKIQFERHTGYKITLLSYQAISLYRMLLRIGLKDQLTQTVRDGICTNIHRQLSSTLPHSTHQNLHA